MNGTPAFLAAREVVRAMLDAPARDGGGRGSIVLVSSVLASHPSPRLFATHAYAAVKGAEVALARTMAADYAPAGDPGQCHRARTGRDADVRTRVV